MLVRLDDSQRTRNIADPPDSLDLLPCAPTLSSTAPLQNSGQWQLIICVAFAD